MTNEEKVEAYRMRLEGATFQEIANKFGCSRQNVHQIVPFVDKGFVKPSFTCIYPNIEKWRRKNRITLNQLSYLCGISYQTIVRSLSVKGNPTKKVIDSILEATGLTYEEAFKTEE